MEMNSASQNLKYFPQLDGLRTLAISLVILFHWFPEQEVIQAMATGPLGVTLFFVLSGFLITLILLNGRRYLSETGFFSVYRNFMIRRILRIFPIYYFVLFFVWAAQFLLFLPVISTQFYDHPVHYIAYASNFLIAKHNDWSDVLSIYWTLAVEEQFYLLWPVVILLTSRRYLKFAIISCIIGGIAARGALMLAGDSSGVLMPTCLDSFGFGGIWALTIFNENGQKEYVSKIHKYALLGLLLYIVFCFCSNDFILKVLFFRTSMSVLCLYFVVMASYKGGFRYSFGKFLGHSYVRFLGKISYGIYVYHILVPQFIVPSLLKLSARILSTEIVLSPGMYRILSLFLLGLISTASWYLLELPFRYLKKGFQLSLNRS